MWKVTAESELKYEHYHLFKGNKVIDAAIDIGGFISIQESNITHYSRFNEIHLNLYFNFIRSKNHDFKNNSEIRVLWKNK